MAQRVCDNCHYPQGRFRKYVYPIPVGVIAVCVDVEACMKRRSKIDPRELGFKGQNDLSIT